MRRRGLLALLAPLTAGCLGGVEVSRQGEQSVPADGGQAPTNESATTATPAPTTPGPSGSVASDRQAAARRLRVASSRLREAVSAYAGTASVAAVTAGDEFVARDVYVSLVEASGAVEEARALAATDDQRARAAAMSGVVAFLSHATAGQTAMGTGHDALLSVPTALRNGDVSRARAVVDDLDADRREVEQAASLVRSESTESDVETTDVVADDGRRLKLAQFDAAVVALDDAVQPVRALVDGVERLVDARAAAVADDRDEATSLASDAEQTLEDAETDLGDLADSLPEAAGPFADAADALADYAAARDDEAADVRRGY